jgi:hypothetical protein
MTATGSAPAVIDASVAVVAFIALVILVLVVPTSKDNWDRLDVVFKGFGAITIPVTLFALGIMVQHHREATEREMKAQELKLKQIETAQKLGPNLVTAKTDEVWSTLSLIHAMGFDAHSCHAVSRRQKLPRRMLRHGGKRLGIR